MTEVFLESLYQLVKEKQTGEATGHDWAHTGRVYRMMGEIAAGEGFSGDLTLLLAAALLHDYADHKFVPEKEERRRMIREVLEPYGLTDEQVGWLHTTIESVSFSKNSWEDSPEPAVQILRDADRLDSLGAIGIARTFAYGGRAGRVIYDETGETPDSVSHFYEKLLLLKDGMYTAYGKQAAEVRHRFLEEFLRQFYLEFFGEQQEN